MRKLTLLTALTVFAAASASMAGPLAATVSYNAALRDWQAGRYDPAYEEFLVIRNSGGAHARTLDTDYYLLTAGCHNREAAVAQVAQTRLRYLAADKRDQGEGGSQWRGAFQREYARCLVKSSPGAPPPDVQLSDGVLRRPSLPAPGTNSIYKSPSGDPFASGMAPQATSPVLDLSESLPKALLDLDPADPAAARATVNKLLGDRAAVADRVILIRASTDPRDYDLAAVKVEVDAFTHQLETDLGLPKPDAYLFAIIYPRANGDPDPLLPAFPIDDRVIGLSDTRTDTAFVIAQGRLKGTVFHELTHLYVDGALGPEAPEWLSEGLASLYEQTVLNDGRYVGDRNYRGAWLQCRPQLVPSVEKLVTSGWYLDGELMGEVDGGDPGVTYRLGDQAGVTNAAERYLARFLQDRGQLAAVVKHYVQLKEGRSRAWALQTRPGSIQTFEAATGEPIATTNAAFAAWWKVDVAGGTGQLPQQVGNRFHSPEGCRRLFDPNAPEPKRPNVRAPKSPKAKRAF